MQISDHIVVLDYGEKISDGSADFVSHRPDQLDHCLRWLCQTPSESALGLMLPATAEAAPTVVQLTPASVLRKTLVPSVT
jgi:hypothetical protein